MSLDLGSGSTETLGDGALFPSEWEINRASGYRDRSRRVRRRLPVLATLLLALAVLVGIAASVQPAVGIIAVALIPAVAVVAWRPSVVTIAVIGMIYANAPVVLQRVSGGSAAGAVVPLLLVVPLAHRVFVERKPMKLTFVFPFIMLYGLAMLVSALAADDLIPALGQVSGFVLEGLALFVLVTSTVRTTSLLRKVLWAVVIAGAFLGLLSGIQQVTGNYNNDFMGLAQVSNSVIDTASDAGTAATNTHGETGQPRLAGPVGEKNRYAQIMVLLVPIGLSLMRDASKRQRWILAGCIALQVTGMALTFSRGAIVGLVVAFLLAVAMRAISVKALAVAAVVGALALASSPTYLERVTSLTKLATGGQTEGLQSADNSIRGRATENFAALRAFEENLLTGVGPGAFPKKYVYYAQKVGGRPRLEEREAHNLYLGIAAELGLPGIASFLAILGVTIAGLRRTRRAGLKIPADTEDPVLRKAREREPLATGLLLALTTYMVTGIFLHLSYQRYFWLLLALCAVAGRPPQRWHTVIATRREQPRIPAVTLRNAELADSL